MSRSFGVGKKARTLGYIKNGFLLPAFQKIFYASAIFIKSNAACYEVPFQDLFVRNFLGF